MRPNITELVVEQDICIGCGICDSVCPVDVLHMGMNGAGEYVPSEIPGCLDKCTFCLDACPFLDGNKDEDTLGKIHFSENENIQYHAEAGYYLNSYVCHVSNESKRLERASGGITTWLLEALLTNDIIDHVICISANDDPEKLFTYKIYDDNTFTSESVGSVYYPVEMSEVMDQVLKTPGRYAITGLPCFIKAIKLAQESNRKLRERIKVTIGLTCGQMKSTYYTQYLASLSGIEGDLQNVHYRGKSKMHPASNYYFSCTDHNGKSGKTYWLDGATTAWNNRWFTPNACSYCDDTFGETADISVMDAWLPEYSKDYKGTTLVIVRNKDIDTLFQNALVANEIQGKNISINTVLKSQRGVIDIKRKQLPYRLHMAEKNGLKVPKKRVEASSKLHILKKIEVIYKTKMQAFSRKIAIDNTKVDKEYIQRMMAPSLNRIMMYRKVYFFLTSPLRLIRKYIKLIRKK